MTKGYHRIPVELRTLEMYGSWLLVTEELAEKVRPSGLVTNVNKKATTVGRVLKTGSGLKEDIQEGDRIVYEEWMGGKWSIDDVDCLIMTEENVLMVIEREEA